ncbi:MAG: hypothetical protein BWX53_00519 [Parcubacteria group bacterium ADurb.Bin016]|nr:MAG: hypothetical protein BWX53_00519 [Parcubacteria group bacterium ADurb.Bin016]
MRSLGIVIIASTLPISSFWPRSAIFRRWTPSKVKGLVTTAIVKAPKSRASSAIIGEAPVPVPPPKPQVINTISAPFKASLISFCDSAAASRPKSGFIPAPKPLVIVLPICILRGDLL